MNIGKVRSCVGLAMAILPLVSLPRVARSQEFWSGPTVTSTEMAPSAGTPGRATTLIGYLDAGDFPNALQQYFGKGSNPYVTADGKASTSMYDPEIAKWVIYLDGSGKVSQDVVFDNEVFSSAAPNFLPGERFISVVVFASTPTESYEATGATIALHLELRHEIIDESVGYAESALQAIGATVAKLSPATPQPLAPGVTEKFDLTLEPIAVGGSLYHGILPVPLKENTFDRLVLYNPSDEPGILYSQAASTAAVVTNFFNGERSHLSLGFAVGEAINAPKDRADTYTRFRTNVYVTGEWYLNQRDKPLATPYTAPGWWPFRWALVGGVDPQLDEFIVGTPLIIKSFISDRLRVLPFYGIVGARFAHVNVNPTNEGQLKRWRPSPFFAVALPLF